MKKIMFAIVTAAVVAMSSANAEAGVVGVGVAPAHVVNPAQGRIMARRAAIVDVYRKLGRSNIRILKEVWNGEVYQVEAE